MRSSCRRWGYGRCGHHFSRNDAYSDQCEAHLTRFGIQFAKKIPITTGKTAATCLITGAHHPITGAHCQIIDTHRQITGGTSVNNIATLPNNTDILQEIPYEPQELLYNNQETPSTRNTSQHRKK
jgi:hypothetical protein